MTATTTRLPRRATRAVILRESSVTATLLRTRNFGPWVSLLDDEGLLQPDLLAPPEAMTQKAPEGPPARSSGG